MLDDRKLEVLRAIVRDFVSTNEPVGSKALAERYQLGVSPATVRNDMAALEDEGYITQPHTSAGRIPTDRGYRLFVDKLSTVKPLSPAERRAIQNFLEGAVDLDDVVRRTARLLAQLTRQVAVVQYPSLSRSGGYCTTATWRVNWASSRTVRRTTSSRSTAPSRKFWIARRSAGDSGLTVDSLSTKSRYPRSVGIRPALVCGWVM